MLVLMRANVRTVLLTLMFVVSAAYLCADDGAASIGAGGIVVMKHEPRIVMAKEVLQISTNRVIVDYDFRNDSDEDITTEVAFPIPDYDFDINRDGSEQGFDDFKLWIDGSPAHFQIEARAFLKDKEYSGLLSDMHVDIAGFGNGPLMEQVNGRQRVRAVSQDIERLTGAERAKLRNLGLVDADGGDMPLWHVKKKYHWQQTFPAHKTVHIRHEYTPVLGANNGFGYAFGPKPDKLSADELKSFCVAERLRSKLESTPGDRDGGYVYVDFILTTANTWKTPIEDFTLIVERPHTTNNRGETESNYVSFCWDEPIAKMDADHFSAHTTNLIPTKELRIGFISVAPAK